MDVNECTSSSNGSALKCQTQNEKCFKMTNNNSGIISDFFPPLHKKWELKLSAPAVFYFFCQSNRWHIKPEQISDRVGTDRISGSAHLACKDASCCSDIISQTSSVITECSHIAKADHRDPPESITWENIFSTFAFYLPGEEIEACLCYGQTVTKDTRSFSDEQHSKLFWTSLTFCTILKGGFTW